MRILLMALLLVLSGKAKSQDFFLFVGTYAAPNNNGIHVYRFYTQDARVEFLSDEKANNPSYLALSPDSNHLYAVEEIASKEGTGGQVVAYSFNKETGQLQFLHRQHSWGDHPCHVVLDNDGSYAAVANYSGGSVSLLKILPDGSLGPASVTPHSGSGPHPRQKAPHAHANAFSPDNEWMVTTDLGTDEVIAYKFNKETGVLLRGKKTFARSTPGAGPRMPLFRPDGKYLYVVEELTGTISTYRFKKGQLKKIQRLSTMQAGDTSFAGSAHIALSPDGQFLYASNRGTANDLAIFRVGKKGMLSLMGHHPSGGRTPRFFSIDPTGKYLLVANQNSDEIVIYERNRLTGELYATGKKISIGKPVCLQWMAVP